MFSRKNQSLVTSRAMKSPGAGAARAKTARNDTMGNQSHPARLATTGSESCVAGRETTARSVDSQHESSMIELRNETYRGSLCCEVRRGNTEAPSRQGAKSCRGPRIGQTCKRVVREHGKSETSLSGQRGSRGHLVNKARFDAGQDSVPAPEPRTNRIQARYDEQFAATESPSKRLGCLSGLIVPI